MTAARVYEEIEIWLAEHGAEPELLQRVREEVLDFEGDDVAFLEAARGFKLGSSTPFACFVASGDYACHEPVRQIENPPN